MPRLCREGITASLLTGSFSGPASEWIEDMLKKSNHGIQMKAGYKKQDFKLK